MVGSLNKNYGQVENKAKKNIFLNLDMFYI